MQVAVSVRGRRQADARDGKIHPPVCDLQAHPPSLFAYFPPSIISPLATADMSCDVTFVFSHLSSELALKGIRARHTPAL